MAQKSEKASLSHEERTATEPRDQSLHPVVLKCVSKINDRIRTFKFTAKDGKGINFLPGQWLDVHAPGVDKAGGFTITSSPRHAIPNAQNEAPFFELAVQKSPENPPAAWLWQSEDIILGKELNVRVGGSFVWPPPGISTKIKRAVFVAGGVGINPLISMISHILEGNLPIEVRILYSTKVPALDTQPAEVLFLPQLLDLFRKPRSSDTKNRIELFVTGTWDGAKVGGKNDEPIHPLMSLTLPNLDADTEVPIVAWTHRIDESALNGAVGDPEEARESAFYVCGPPDMTDSIVDYFKKQESVRPEHVFCEKWW